MWNWLSVYGVGTSFFVLLIGLPALYYFLAMDAHRELTDSVGWLLKENLLSKSHLERLEAETQDELSVFELDWWIVLAFGVLVASILAAGVLLDHLTTGAVDVTHAANAITVFVNPTILPDGQPPLRSEFRNAMALYAASIGLIVAFRLAWVRLALSRRVSSFQRETIRLHLKAQKPVKRSTKLKG